jgi:hypothetical protein
LRLNIWTIRAVQIFVAVDLTSLIMLTHKYNRQRGECIGFQFFVRSGVVIQRGCGQLGQEVIL